MKLDANPAWIVVLALLAFTSTTLRGASDVFTDLPIWRVSITISPQNAAKLKTHPREYVPASIRISGGEVFPEVGVHLKGSTGSFRDLDEKPSLTLNFTKYAPHNRFHGLEKVHLNNSVEDPSYLNEEIGSEIFRSAGVPAPRVTHGLVELNGRQLGLYVVKEGFAPEFLKHNFGKADGNFYEPIQGGDVGRLFRRHSGLGPDTQSDLGILSNAVSESDLSQRWRRLQEILDTDRFISFMAVEIMIGHRDGYSLARNNFRIYQDTASGKLVFLPAGLDQLFEKADTTWKPHMAGTVAKAMMEIPAVQKAYAERFAKLLKEAMVPARLCKQLDSRLESLGSGLPQEIFSTLKTEKDALCHHIYERRANLTEQLSRGDLTPLAFTNGEASLHDWQPKDAPAGGGLQVDNPSGILIIFAGPVTSASWRTAVLLPKGRYRFSGKARTEGAMPLPFGSNQGAKLRIAGGGAQSSSLLGTSGWTRLEFEFEVKSASEAVELLCELRASAGKALFDRNSFRLIAVQ